MAYIDQTKLNYNERLILSELSKVKIRSHDNMIHYMMSNVLNHADVEGFRQMILELGQMIDDNKEMMTRVIGEKAVTAVVNHYCMFKKEYQMVESLITKALNQEHLDMGAQWIIEKIVDKWSAYSAAVELRKLIQVRNLELQCLTRPVEEGECS